MIYGVSELINELEKSKRECISERNDLETIKNEELKNLDEINSNINKFISEKPTNEKLYKKEKKYVLKRTITNIAQILLVAAFLLAPLNLLTGSAIVAGKGIATYNLIVSVVSLMGISLLTLLTFDDLKELKKSILKEDELKELEKSQDELEEYINELNFEISKKNKRINRFTSAISSRKKSLEYNEIGESTISKTKQKIIENN